jgi:hypothetical protein
MLPRPTKSLTVKSAQGGHDIVFTPSDLKSLGSQLWAQTKLVDKSGTPVRTKFIGGRCNDKDPKTDPKTGRILSQDCFDNNPSAWHKAIINQIGVSKRPTVMDATYDYEVWNHPILSYSYKYFNPQTQQRTYKIKDAVISKKEFTSDKFKEYRDEDAKKFVGVIMEVTYGVETRPTTNSTDSIRNDGHHTAYYTYDLELDKKGNIIGGEWYTTKHPDFLWTPPKGAVSRSDYEQKFSQYFQGTWDIKKDSVPKNWAYFAKPIISNGQKYAGASESGQPIGVIVEALLNASSEKTEVVDTAIEANEDK